MAGKSSKMKSRLSTIRYEMTRDFMSDFASKRVPQFTEEHENKLMEVFGIPNLKTCIVTGEKVAKSGGDHLFEVRGYLKKTGKVGIEQKWNRLPVSTGENIRYKKYKFTENGKEYVKNIGYELLTEDELRQCSKEKKALYHKIRNWVNYCERQNVSLGYIMPKEAEKEMEIAIEKAMEILLLGIENMKNSV